MTSKQNKNKERLGQKQYNNEGCLMCVVEYKNARDIVVEFQDKYKTRVYTQYNNFLLGQVKNPYYPTVYGFGIIGKKYPMSIGYKLNKEYKAWDSIIQRCFDKEFKEQHPTYQDVVCCNEWLLYENFYEWLHKQENFDKWREGDKWAIDKDILIKGNKIYSPETCCLVPMNINNLFTKRDAYRGKLPIGVVEHGNGFRAQCNNPLTNKREFSKTCYTVETTFKIYKTQKENIIKQIAQIEYDKGNIIEKCYEAMMNYEVEITD